jgi:hypothetical protein
LQKLRRARGSRTRLTVWLARWLQSGNGVRPVGAVGACAVPGPWLGTVAAAVGRVGVPLAVVQRACRRRKRPTTAQANPTRLDGGDITRHRSASLAMPDSRIARRRCLGAPDERLPNLSGVRRLACRPSTRRHLLRRSVSR